MIKALSTIHRYVFPEIFGQMHRARAMAFHGRLGWDVEVENGLEMDSYDRDEDAIYLIALDHFEQSTASLRLLPTTGSTMIKGEFADLFDEPIDIERPTTWECTRFCVHPMETPTSGDASAELLLGLYQLCRLAGIESIVGIYDRRMTRVYSRIGWSPSPVACGQGGKEGLLLGLWDVTPEATRKLRSSGSSSAPVIEFSLLPLALPPAKTSHAAPDEVSPMYKHVAEAFVPVSHAKSVAEKVCARASDYCRLIGATGADRLLHFRNARAILRPTDEGLHFRVEAQDFITFYGVRTLLQGSLSAMTFPGAAVEWHPDDSVPFDAMQGGSENERNWLGGR
ncbi:hypothetical protein DUT91_14920 [Phyllobacterium salinisoli]|uniref:Acyl-homoserine-lactone synthase n=1 Tax=Phyllobacterium salinisoli TaxID=1899321 RepID=A0A368K069_9HYPH|nr:acyl-homoserine-lactone synthase [Phyllobacterium salinisoli]RCS22796.1 hypothetical protein DUT91_14920 [Phyllobacterium salinisoli]